MALQPGAAGHRGRSRLQRHLPPFSAQTPSAPHGPLGSLGVSPLHPVCVSWQWPPTGPFLPPLSLGQALVPPKLMGGNGLSEFSGEVSTHSSFLEPGGAGKGLSAVQPPFPWEKRPKNPAGPKSSASCSPTRDGGEGLNPHLRGWEEVTGAPLPAWHLPTTWAGGSNPGESSSTVLEPVLPSGPIIHSTEELAFIEHLRPDTVPLRHLASLIFFLIMNSFHPCDNATK